jgi:rare lipoprotein A (peptidoglycan hydrolase)
LKAKTKRKIVHLVTRKKLVRRKASRHVLRSFFILVTTVCMGSLVFAVAVTKPTVDTGLRTQLHSSSVNIDVKASSAPPVDQTGRGSWYALGLRSPESQTCASTTFPRGTYLSVTNLNNNKNVVCLVNDYGPEAWTGRVIDLSIGSFRVVEDPSRGTIPVQIRVVPAPPQAININIPNALGNLSGYSWCQTSHTPQYCEQNRQKQIPLP